MIVLVLTAVICATVLAALVLVLSHLAEMRGTSGEMEELRSALEAGGRAADANLAALKRAVDDHENRLVHLNNRTLR